MVLKIAKVIGGIFVMGVILIVIFFNMIGLGREGCKEKILPIPPELSGATITLENYAVINMPMQPLCKEPLNAIDNRLVSKYYPGSKEEKISDTFTVDKIVAVNRYGLDTFETAGVDGRGAIVVLRAENGNLYRLGTPVLDYKPEDFKAIYVNGNIKGQINSTYLMNTFPEAY